MTDYTANENAARIAAQQDAYPEAAPIERYELHDEDEANRALLDADPHGWPEAAHGRLMDALDRAIKQAREARGEEPAVADYQGFVDDLDEATYHAHATSLSVTGAKVLLKAPALFKWQQEHPVHKDVFDIGSAAHKLVLGVGPDLIVHEYDAEKVKSPKGTKAWKEQQAEVRNAGNILLLPDEHEQITAMADALSSHRLAMRLLSEGRPEVSAFCPDEETGVMRRCRFDWLGPAVLTDYKTAASSDPRELAGRYGAIRKWGYDAQAAWYTDLARDLGHPAPAFAFIFQMKEPPYLVTVATLREDDLWDARQRNRRALEMFRDCSESGIWPGYLPDDTAAVVSLTEQTYEEELVS